MKILEVFFDYACPFCLQGHNELLEILPQYPAIEIKWRPCEAHPRPESYGRHSDICARAMYFAKECGVDLWEFHRLMYQLTLNDRLNIEELDVVAEALSGLFDAKAFRTALSSGAYLDELLENNRLAWADYQFPAVPSYRLQGQNLPSVCNVGVSKKQLIAFIDGIDRLV